MPHLTLEYTDNLPDFDPDRVLFALNQAMLDSGLFDEPDIKSRAIAIASYRIGISDTRRAFAHIRAALLAGRSGEQRRKLAASLLATLRTGIAPAAGLEIQLSVETVDIDRPSYAKEIVHAS